jgi:hypothetical protein
MEPEHGRDHDREALAGPAREPRQGNSERAEPAVKRSQTPGQPWPTVGCARLGTRSGLQEQTPSRIEREVPRPRAASELFTPAITLGRLGDSTMRR